MTVWKLFRSLLPLIVRGRGRYPMYVVLNDQEVRDLMEEGETLKEILYEKHSWQIDFVDSEPSPEDRFAVMSASTSDDI